MDTHEAQPVCAWVVRDIIRQVPARHAIRNELEGIDGDAHEWDNVWVYQVFPDYRDLVKGLGISLAPESEKNTIQRTYLLGALCASLGVRVYALNPYLRTIEGPLIHASRGGRKGDVQNGSRKNTRFREHLLDAAYLSELLQ